jgi:hypothetical protein
MWECDPVLINVILNKAEEVSCELTHVIYRSRLIASMLVLKGYTSLTNSNETGILSHPLKDVIQFNYGFAFFIQECPHAADVVT